MASEIGKNFQSLTDLFLAFKFPKGIEADSKITDEGAIKIIDSIAEYLIDLRELNLNFERNLITNDFLESFAIAAANQKFQKLEALTLGLSK